MLCSLLLNDELGQKFFNPQNVHQTFELAFNLVEQSIAVGHGGQSGGGPDRAWMFCHCVDLFVDLLQSKEVFLPLLEFQRLPACLGVLIKALGNDSGNTVLPPPHPSLRPSPPCLPRAVDDSGIAHLVRRAWGPASPADLRQVPDQPSHVWSHLRSRR